jgi:hypothetical protein
VLALGVVRGRQQLDGGLGVALRDRHPAEVGQQIGDRQPPARRRRALEQGRTLPARLVVLALHDVDRPAPGLAHAAGDRLTDAVAHVDRRVELGRADDSSPRRVRKYPRNPWYQARK